MPVVACVENIIDKVVHVNLLLQLRPEVSQKIFQAGKGIKVSKWFDHPIFCFRRHSNFVLDQLEDAVDILLERLVVNDETHFADGEKSLSPFFVARDSYKLENSFHCDV